MDNLTTNLKFFKKYNQSTKDNSEEKIEKIEIFNKFMEEVDNIKAIHKLTLNDLSYELSNQPQSPVSSYSNSSASPIQQQGQFTMKSFHNSSIKKRFSLPPNNNNNTPKKNGSSSKYKRLSTGLQLGLLTVFEEETPKSQPKRISTSNSAPPSYDDNYLNILPPSQYETYNLATLDQLTKCKNNRYSLNSVQSNISGLTDLTSFEDESNTNRYTKDELRMKLEEKFNLKYNEKPNINKVESLESQEDQIDQEDTKFENKLNK
ncbi:unnamed protein product [Candida verbasci]|uniref:Uncharacterized protein n=1 Tax=Candida verbasci TaxID=1227364 RepID=A0A9W4XB36_9ASCO|nr:unnamed protein product [Candida verbasci]